MGIVPGWFGPKKFGCFELVWTPPKKRSSKGTLREFQGSFKDLLGKFQGNVKKMSSVFKENFNEKFFGGFKDV